MLAGELDVYNLALNAIGSRSNISSPSQKSRDAEVCNLWFSVVRDQILAAAVWPEATKIESLALFSDPAVRSGYAYSYAYPVDLLRPQYLTSFERFLVTSTGTQSLINTNDPAASLVYTTRQVNVGVWSSELQMAIVYGLASHICRPLTGRNAMARELMNEANNILISARESAANASNESMEYIPDWIAARGFFSRTETSYYYPLGPMLSLPHGN